MKNYAVGIGAIAVAIVVVLWVVNVRTAKAPEAPVTVATTTTTVSTTTTTTTTTGGGILPYNSGVRGTVWLGPTCPVERIPPDPACAEKPYATAIAVYRAGSSAPFVIGNSDASGAFEFSLPPDSYTLKASGGTMLPRCTSTNITVTASEYATTTISCDTGIR